MRIKFMETVAGPAGCYRRGHFYNVPDTSENREFLAKGIAVDAPELPVPAVPAEAFHPRKQVAPTDDARPLVIPPPTTDPAKLELAAALVANQLAGAPQSVPAAAKPARRARPASPVIRKPKVAANPKGKASPASESAGG
ncbi:MAG TPA: hypothetical protein VGN72_07605 [Tepidisphaeraceae bacterium]|jgi:hypothetical protein|nr:hypothetical protein [Tepidisphaeraceae bacterium]